MIYGSVCSGVEAATVAWEPLGWKPAWFCEFDKFPSAVLKHHYPNVPNLGDMTKIEERTEYRDRAIDLLVGGTPCQSFSVAGLRKGLDDDRGNLAIKFGEILAQKRPRWFVWENVPGVLSSNGGQDFATFLGLVCGRKLSVPENGWGNSGIIKGYKNAYGIAYRTLDAQYFGVPQRRRRAFVVGHLGNWQAAAAVLFEQDSLHGNPPPRRENREKVAGYAGKSAKGSHWDGLETHPSLNQSHNTGGIGASNQEILSQRGTGLVGHRMAAFGEYVDDDLSSTIKARDYKDATDLVCSVHGTQDPDILEGFAHTLGCNRGQENAVFYDHHMQDSRIKQVDVSPTIHAKAGTGGGNLPLTQAGMAVRRLTPIECERLQGFPDNYTRIPWRGKPAEDCPDGHRYKAMGNSMAVPVMRWIGERIKMANTTILTIKRRDK